MLWIVVICTIAVLLFVLLAKRPVNTAGLQSTWQVPQPSPPSTQPVAPTTPPPAPVEVTTVNFNDLFSGKASSSDRPNA
ncbi:MAG: hypothetical protein ACKV2T_25205 [Kofleriaceae bacterium]